MPEPATLALFATASLALLLVPGPAVLYVVAQGVGGGRRAGLAAVAGVHLGSVGHIAAAAVGLSAVLASSATAFTVVKLAGAAYLVALGLRELLGARREPTTPRAHTAEPLARVVRRGAVVNLLNPKTALFFLAFLPQFVDPARPAAPQIAALGAVWIAAGVLSDGAYAVLAGSLPRLLRTSRASRGHRLVRSTTGGTYLCLGAWAATADGAARKV